MHTSFLPLLCCPQTQQPLTLEITHADGDNVIAGQLNSSQYSYPIVRGIPRFVDYEHDNYSASFGFQWNKWARVQFEDENIGKPMSGITRNTFEGITLSENQDFNGQTIADFGCGPGRYIDIARRKGARVIGIEFSAAVEAAAKNFANDPDVLICQADALNPPLKANSLDGIFTIGVLHHTPAPAHGVQMIANIIKPGGWAAVSVYHYNPQFHSKIVKLYRRSFQALKPAFGHRPATMYAYFAASVIRPLAKIPLLGSLLRRLFPFVDVPDWRWSILDTFDSVTPVYQSAHTCYETHQWLASNQLTNIVPSKAGQPTAWLARKPTIPS